MTTETKTISLLDYNNESPITYLWYCGVGCPTGIELRHNTTTEDQDEYCDFAELEHLRQWADLQGTVDDSGRWNWNGEDDVRDSRGNTIQRIVAARI